MRHHRARWAVEARRPSDETRHPQRVDEEIDRLSQAVRPYFIDLDHRARERLRIFADELVTWNGRFNLLSRADEPNVVRKHVAASLGVFLVAQPVETETWIDVGTGAGFPGMVLKIVQPGLRMTLLDSARKRCLFLENTARRLDLGRIPILPLRVETLVARGEGLGMYNLLTARAVTSLAQAVMGFGPLVACGGRLVTFKGPQWHEEVAALAEGNVMAKSGFVLEAATRIPWTTGHLLTLRRTE